MIEQSFFFCLSVWMKMTRNASSNQKLLYTRTSLFINTSRMLLN